MPPSLPGDDAALFAAGGTRSTAAPYERCWGRVPMPGDRLEPSHDRTHVGRVLPVQGPALEDSLTLSAMFSHEPPTGVYKGIIP